MTHKKGNFFLFIHPFWTCQKCLSNCHFVCVTWDFRWFLPVIQWFQHWMMEEWKNSNRFILFSNRAKYKMCWMWCEICLKRGCRVYFVYFFGCLRRFEAFFVLFLYEFCHWLSFVSLVVNVRIKLFVFVNLTVDIWNNSG